jgi:hypothetical protein
MSNETTWKNELFKPPVKEPMVNSDLKLEYSNMTPPFLPDALLSKPSCSKKPENPKRIPLFEDIYDTYMIDDNNDGAMLVDGSLQEGMNLSTKKLSKEDKEFLSTNENTKKDFKQMQLNASRNLDMSGGNEIELLKKKNRDKIKEIEAKLRDTEKTISNYNKDLNAEPPEKKPSDSKIESKKSAEETKKNVTKSVNQISFSSNLVLENLKGTVDLGSEKIKQSFIECKYIYRRFVVNISQALTQNNATKTEIDTFSSEIIKVLTVLLSGLILYNWYYVMFFLEPREQYKLNLTYYEKNHSFLYGILGPPLRAVETVDWFLLEVVPLIKKYVNSKIVIFFIMSTIFLHMVKNNFAEQITNDFFNAVNNKFNPTLLCISVILFVLIYGGLWWWGIKNYDVDNNPESWWKKGTLNTIIWFILFCVYIIAIIIFGVPIGAFALCSFFFLYSFFAIIIYNGFNISSTFVAVSEHILNASEINKDEGDEEGLSWTTKIYRFFKGILRYAYIYMFEIFMLYILINGIHTYKTGYTIPFVEKATFKNINSLGGAVSTAFQNLYTWLIIINVLLIILIVVIMKIKYNNLHSVIALRKASETIQKLNSNPVIH